jgi:hypothetical protein
MLPRRRQQKRMPDPHPHPAASLDLRPSHCLSLHPHKTQHHHCIIIVWIGVGQAPPCQLKAQPAQQPAQAADAATPLSSACHERSRCWLDCNRIAQTTGSVTVVNQSKNGARQKKMQCTFCTLTVTWSSSGQAALLHSCSEPQLAHGRCHLGGNGKHRWRSACHGRCGGCDAI